MKELLSMPKYKPIDLMSRNKSVMGYHLGRLDGAEEKIQRAVNGLLRLVNEGKLSPVIDKVFPYTQSAEAHQYIQDRKNFGKVLLNFGDNAE
jgi:NADPH:quinone reductase-like Zn-dependent oxidoreductase